MPTKRKQTQTNLQTDLAEAVGADLSVMERDAGRMRYAIPFPHHHPSPPNKQTNIQGISQNSIADLLQPLTETAAPPSSPKSRTARASTTSSGCFSARGRAAARTRPAWLVGTAAGGRGGVGWFSFGKKAPRRRTYIRGWMRVYERLRCIYASRKWALGVHG